MTAGLITRAQAVTIRASDGIVDTPPEPMAPMPRVLEPEVSDATRRPEPPNPAAPTTAPNGLTASLAAVQASRLDQRRLGLMLAVLALVGLATDLLGVTTDVFIAPWRLAGADAGDAIHATASVIALLGASQMVRGITGGRRLVGLSLAANIGASLVWDRLADPLTLMVIGGWVALLYVVTRRL